MDIAVVWHWLGHVKTKPTKETNNKQARAFCVKEKQRVKWSAKETEINMGSERFTNLSKFNPIELCSA